MKIKVGDYEVEIKAKWNGDARMSKEVTMYFMNSLSLYCAEGSRNLENAGIRANASEARRWSNDIYKALKAEGLYK